jgi:hypothetical protein
MCAAFPRSEYYGGSAPPAPSAGVAPIPARPSWPEGGRGTHADGSHVHCRPVDGSGTRLYPCGIASGYFAVIRRWPPGQGLQTQPGVPRPSWRAGAHRTPARIHRIRAGDKSRGVTQPVPRVYLSVSLTAPGPSGSAEPARLCRGCSRPPRRPPDQAASSFTPPPRRRGDGRSLTSIRKRQRLVAHAGSYQVTRSAGYGGPGRPADRFKAGTGCGSRYEGQAAPEAVVPVGAGSRGGRQIGSRPARGAAADMRARPSREAAGQTPSRRWR